ncbi:di/tricarboxylate transporter [Stella humosa]|uniref:Di/tricarboxylate transporter n=1 Tax=Stella humosa TaxID=94 RepID=A0A3N1KU80_9PROT|nr:SLC13 family permease [Stella humosa]ROP83544.1 di/tricarboxylate transporter [Stella humosa]BBK33183.1 permease [Stella humosa]
MTTPQILAIAIFGLTLAGFVWDRVRYDIVALTALAACVVAGLVEPDKAFAGFGNAAVITVAAVLVLSQALARSGVVALVGQRIDRIVSTPMQQTALLCIVGAALSAFMNNVGALAIMMPIAIAGARRFNSSPALVLMPLSFATMLGGMCTLIGTPPNLLAAGFRDRYGQPAFDMFDFAPVGIAITAAGIAYMVVVARFLMPTDRKGQASAMEQFDVGHYVTEVRVAAGSELAGQTVQAIEDANDDRLFVVTLSRQGLRLRGRFPTTILTAGDEMLVQAEAELLQGLVRSGALELVAAHTSAGLEEKPAEPAAIDTAEVIVPPTSWIQGATARSLRLRARFAVNLLALSRRGRPVAQRVRDTAFAPGDVLLLEGDADRLTDAIREMGCLPLANRRIALQPFRIYSSVAIMVAAIGLVTAELLPAPIAFMLGVLAVIACRILPLRDLYESVEWPVVILLGAMIPVGGILESTGLAEIVSGGVAGASGSLPDWGMLGLVLVATMVLTPALNNAATVIVMAPIAIGIAQQLGVNPDAFLMAVAIGASCDFITPFGHQNNTLILAPGGYRFSDYWKMGLPLDAIVLAVAVLLLPIVFPLR